MVFVFDVGKFVADQIVYDFWWGHDYSPIVRDCIVRTASSPTRAVCADLGFLWVEIGLLGDLVGAFCEIMERFFFVPFCEECFCVNWGDCFFP